MTNRHDSNDSWGEASARTDSRRPMRALPPPAQDRDIEAVLQQIVAQIGGPKPAASDHDGDRPASEFTGSMAGQQAPDVIEGWADPQSWLTEQAPPTSDTGAGQNDEERLERLWSVYSSVADAYTGAAQPRAARPWQDDPEPAGARRHEPAPVMPVEPRESFKRPQTESGPAAVAEIEVAAHPAHEPVAGGHWVDFTSADREAPPAPISWTITGSDSPIQFEGDADLIEDTATVDEDAAPALTAADPIDVDDEPLTEIAGLAEINAGFAGLRAQLEALATRFNEFEPLREEVAGLATGIEQLRAEMPGLASDVASQTYEQFSADILARLPSEQPTASAGGEVGDRLETIQGLLLTYARERQAETSSAQAIIGSVEKLVTDVSSRLEVIERTMVGQPVPAASSVAASRAARARHTPAAPGGPRVIVEEPAAESGIDGPGEQAAAELPADASAPSNLDDTAAQQAAAEAWNSQSRSRLNALRASMRANADAPAPEPKAPASRDDMIAAARRAAQAVSNRTPGRGAGPVSALREQAPVPRAQEPVRSILGFITPRHAIALLAIVMVSLGAGVLYSKMMKARQAPVVRIEQSGKIPQADAIQQPAAGQTGSSKQSLLDDPNFNDPLPEGDAASAALAAAEAIPADGSEPASPASLGDTAEAGLAQPAEAMPKPDLPPAAIGPLSLRTAAVEGDPAAQYEIGQRYTQAKGKDRDLVAAAKWFELAANAGHTLSKYRLGSLYERGLGVLRDLNKARAWYQAAAEKGNVKAMHNLAVLHTGQDGSDPDYAAAGEWFAKAAEFGLADSQFNLAVLHESGLGMERNLPEAYKWYLLAAARGDEEAKKRGAGVRAKLAPQAAADVKKAVKAWKPKPADRSANEGTVIGGLSQAKPATQPVTVSFTPGEQVTPEQIALVQNMLNQLGYNPGSLDGTMTFETREAIRQFEERSGMEPTGNLSAELIRRLGELAG